MFRKQLSLCKKAVPRQHGIQFGRIQDAAFNKLQNTAEILAPSSLQCNGNNIAGGNAWTSGPQAANIFPVSSDYQQLLDAVIQHLEDLKADGVQFVNVSRETLAALRQPLPQPAPYSQSTIQPQPAPAPSVVPQPPAIANAAPQTRSKAEALDALRKQTMSCVRCPNLASSRKTVVFGVGNPDAELMFVGEAPGIEEDQQGEPFVGAAGQLLTRIIQTMGLSRSSVYIANILKCRPDTPGQTSGNRKPAPVEMQNCLPYLQQQIEIIKPRVLVALGATAVEGLIGKTEGITKIRGQWREYLGIPLMPTYHPAYLLRNQSLSVKRQVWEDMIKVMEKLGMQISAKQRGYFLKST